MNRRLSWVLPLCLSALAGLAGCDMLGIESPEKVAAVRDAEGRAVGGACRHAGRAIEDCYALNRKADKAAVFAGWRDMNDYMRENKIEEVAPVISAQQPAASKPADPEPKKEGAGKAPAKPEKDKEKDKASHGA
jgi:hypothetical protein